MLHLRCIFISKALGFLPIKYDLFENSRLYGDAMIVRGFDFFIIYLELDTGTHVIRASVRRLNFNTFLNLLVHNLAVTKYLPIRVSGETCFVSSRP